MGKSVYILDVDMFIRKVQGKNSDYIDEDIKSPLKMLLLGHEISESELFDKLSKGNISLYDLKSELKFDYVCQMSEDGYRYIKNELELNASLSLLKSMKDFGVNYNIIRSKTFLEKYSDKLFFILLLDSTFSTYAFDNGYKYFNSDDGVIYQMEPPDSIAIYKNNINCQILKFRNSSSINIPIHSLIGKNGSGKTYLISKIIKQAISPEPEFRGLGAVFSRLIVVSNTINDKCYRPANITRAKNKLNNYHFVSLTSEKYYNKMFPRGKKLTIFSLLEKIQKRDSFKRGGFEQGYLLDKITENVIPGFSFSIKTNIEEHLYNNFSELTGRYGLINLTSNLDLITNSEIEYALPDVDIQFYKNGKPFTLSSGQLSFLISMFSFIANIESNSLVLIEEPENFLHPSLLTHFINSLTQILRETNSVAIVTTHSALVLREIPSEQVTILQRISDFTTYSAPRIETFGADTHQIMMDVFGDLYSNALFRDELKSIAKDKTISEILRQFAHLPSDILNKIILEKKLK
ncbi:ATP-dependent nuclease [Lelliottia nimipressuralis]|uniref:ATP-dependent nuclease n=1 Tax=Lelliottia nimipressuralis TaxID=69220 RepID=UPI00141BD05B|nr:AAA family ATPase [Lelliottia nimipressuralis]